MELNKDILFYAFRYALGRKTYVVDKVVDSIILNWDKLELSTKRVMNNEITQAIMDKAAGHKMDVDKWKEILELEI